jgi:ATP-dependent Clp protease adaptor protein ClpS
MSKRTNRPGPPFGETREGHFARRPLPGYRVVLFNTPNQTLMFVVRTVMELTRFCREEATHKMWEAHHSGKSQLLITHLERAELYVEQFAERGLRVAIEPTS